MDIDKLIAKMSLEEKIALVAGTDFMYTFPLTYLNIPSLSLSDGPNGLRKQVGKKDNGVSISEPSTSFPSAVTLASSFDKELAYLMGQSIAKEARFYNVHLLLGPAINIKRNPLGGRNFDYFSEDPLLSGTLGLEFVKGIEEQGVGAVLKHFALNNQENYRFMGNSIADIRAIREIYLKPFEMIIRNYDVAAVMTSYNMINGVYSSENHFLINDILRNEWEFKGITMTDWGGIHNRKKALEAGLDLEMPGDTAICRKHLFEGIKDGTLDENILNQSVKRIILTTYKFYQKESSNVDFDFNHDLSGKISEESAVLMKNDGALPINKNEKILVIGELFENMRYQASGSSLVNSTKIVSPKIAFDEHKVDYEYVRGYILNSNEIDNNILQEAIEKSKTYQKVVVFIGLNDFIESEGKDRDNMRLSSNQLELINALIKENKDIIIVLFGGTVVELPFKDDVKAILNMLLPGQNGGISTYRLLFGEVSPSGRLSETWPLSYKDVPFGTSYSQGINELYKESIFVGYRYYNSYNINVAFPFGHGLSYSTFSYSNLEVKVFENKLVVSVKVKNIGKIKAKEVVQIYINNPLTNLRPKKELKAFTKVLLDVNEEKNINLEISFDDLKVFYPTENRYLLEKGEYVVEVSKDVNTPILSCLVNIEGEELLINDQRIIDIYRNNILEISDEDFEHIIGTKIASLPAIRPYNVESRFISLKESFLGKILYKAVLGVANRQIQKGKIMKEGPLKDNTIKGGVFLKRIFDSSSLISMSMSAGNSFPYNFAEAFAHLANGNIFKGIKSFIVPIKAPKQPKKKK